MVVGLYQSTLIALTGQFVSFWNLHMPAEVQVNSRIRFVFMWDARIKLITKVNLFLWKMFISGGKPNTKGSANAHFRLNRDLTRVALRAPWLEKGQFQHLYYDVNVGTRCGRSVGICLRDDFHVYRYLRTAISYLIYNVRFKVELTCTGIRYFKYYAFSVIFFLYK